MRNFATRITAGGTFLLSVTLCASAASFTNIFIFNGTDGGIPVAGLILSGNTLYGTTESGGTNGGGTVFAVNTDGTEFTNLYEFSGPDGKAPYSPLVLSGGILFGTTSAVGFTNGGGVGTIFAVSTNGTGFTNLFAFNGTTVDTRFGLGSLRQYFIWHNPFGGNHGLGTIFAIRTDGTGFTNLYNYNGTINGQTPGCPHAGLVLSGSVLYGVMQQGGTGLDGAVFAINPDGTGFTNLYSFSPTVPVPPSGSTQTNGDGASPVQTLVLSSNILFGTTPAGPAHARGTVFRVNTDGNRFQNPVQPVGSDRRESICCCDIVRQHAFWNLQRAGSRIRNQYRWHRLHQPCGTWC